MNTVNRTRSNTIAVIAAFVLAATLFLPASALAQPQGPPPEEPQGYDSPAIARLSEVLNDTFVLGREDTDWSYAEPNLIVEEGDLIQTNQTGRAELQFQGDETFRVGEDSRIAIIQIANTKVIGMDNGRGYLRTTRLASQDQAFMVTFPNGQLTATEPALVRVDVLPDGSSQISVFRGAIGLETAAESPRMFRGGEQIFVSPNGTIEFARFNPVPRDDFDNWNRDRDILLATYQPSPYLGGDLVGGQDLDGYGDWVYANDYGTYVWRPYVVVDWRPYEYGHWYLSPVYGWTWVPAEPWGYATYHYGSWNFDPVYGWIWVPGHVWRPARVRWVVYDNYVGWVPIGRHGYIVITTYPYHIVDVNIIHIDKHSFIFVDRHDFETHRYFTHHDKIRVVNVEKFKPGRIKVVNDVKVVGIVKTPYKGVAVREKVAYNKFIDVKKHPDLGKKIAVLEKERVVKPGGKGAVSALPRKEKTDVMRAFDYRQQVKEKQVIEKNKWKATEQWKRQAPEKAPAIERGVPERERKLREQAGEPKRELTPPEMGEGKKPERRGPEALEQPGKGKEKQLPAPSGLEERPEKGVKGATEATSGPQKGREAIEQPIKGREKQGGAPKYYEQRPTQEGQPAGRERPEKGVGTKPEMPGQMPKGREAIEQPPTKEKQRTVPPVPPSRSQEGQAGRGKPETGPTTKPGVSEQPLRGREATQQQPGKEKQRTTPPLPATRPQEKAPAGQPAERIRPETGPTTKPGVSDQQRVTPPPAVQKEKAPEGQTGKGRPEMGTKQGPAEQQPAPKPTEQQQQKVKEKKAPPEQEQAPPDDNQPDRGRNNRFDGR